MESSKRSVSAPSPEPTDKVIFVISKHAGVGEAWVRDNRAEVHDAWWDPQGSIDSELRYSPPAKSTSKGSIGLYPLVLTDRHWERAPDGRLHEVTGPMHWEIEGPQTWRWTTVETALRYVTEMSVKSTDPVVRQNAQETITILKKRLR
jgi:hypothetical protein